LRNCRVGGALIEKKELGFATQFAVHVPLKEIAATFSAGMFRDPDRLGHSAIPLDNKID
jgi:hypothetical protein